MVCQLFCAKLYLRELYRELAVKTVGIPSAELMDAWTQMMHAGSVGGDILDHSARPATLADAAM